MGTAQNDGGDGVTASSSGDQPTEPAEFVEVVEPTQPAVSVVIPTAGTHRIGMLESCLSALAGNPGIDTVEVIVVLDGGDIDPYRHLTEVLPHVQLLPRAHGGPGAARNTGWRAARGAVVAFLDDDTEPQPDWLADLRQALLDHPDAAGVGGRVVPMHPRNPVSAMLTVFGHLDHRITRHGALLITCNAAFRRDALAAVDGFRESADLAGEDLDLCERLLATGRHTVRLDTAVVRHHHPTTVDGMLAKCRNYRAGTPESVSMFAEHGPRRTMGRVGHVVAQTGLALVRRLPMAPTVRVRIERVLVAPLFLPHLLGWFLHARRSSARDDTGDRWFTYRISMRRAATMTLLQWQWYVEWERTSRTAT